MRMVPYFEKKQRGCMYCNHMEAKEFGKEIRTACPFDECPYHDLDKYKTYDEFMASDDSLILVGEFFTTVASAYELGSSHTYNRTFSDGDHKVDI